MSFDAGSVIAKIKADVSNFEKGIASSQKKVKSFSSTLKNMAVGLTAGATAIAFASKKFVDLASDSEETQNKFEAVFGSLTNSAEDYTKKLSEAVGRNSTDIKEGLSSFQGFAVGMGLAKDEAYKMATGLQALSIDFASFNNLSDAEAQQRFISAMSGSSEVLDRFGINIKASALDLKLQALGFDETTASATEQQKAIARLSIITESMTIQGAVGDAIKTSDSYANSTKRLRSDLKTLGEEIGQKIIPFATSLVSKILELIKVFKNFSLFLKENKIAIIGISTAITVALIPVMMSLYATIITSLVPAFATLTVAVAPWLLGGAMVGGMVAGVLWLVDNWEFAKNKIIEFWENIKTWISIKWQEITTQLINGIEILKIKWIGGWSEIKNISSFVLESIKNSVFNFWEGIKVIFNSGLDFISEAWGNTWQGIKDTAEGIFDSLIKNIKSKINSVIKLVNDMIRAVNSVDIYGVGSANISTVPQLAEGGIATKPTLAMIGEGGESEAVIPLSKLNNYGGGGSNIFNFNNPILIDEDNAKEIVDQAFNKMKPNLSY